jgi:hypothetical protein
MAMPLTYRRDDWEDDGLDAAAMRALASSPFAPLHGGRSHWRSYKNVFTTSHVLTGQPVRLDWRKLAAKATEAPAPIRMPPLGPLVRGEADDAGRLVRDTERSARKATAARKAMSLREAVQTRLLSDLHALKWKAGIGANSPCFRQLVLKLVDECGAPMPLIADAAGVSIEHACEIVWSERGEAP